MKHFPEFKNMTRAAGPFDVKLAPQPADSEGPESLARLLLDKRFQGDLDGTSHGQMLAVRGAVKGSAGYVAMEVVSASLHGRRGSFALQHSGTMDRSVPTLVVRVVPDSGTGELEGLSGSMQIDIAEGGAHSYVFEYELPAG